MLKCHWIDDGGGWQKARSPHLDLTGRGQYAFCHLGMAKIGGYHPRTLQWDLKRVRPDTLVAARKWLAEQVGMRPVSLAYYFGGWFVEQLNNGLEALDRIDRLCAYRDAAPPTGSSEKRVEFQTGIFARPIRMTNELWQRDKGRLTHDDAADMAALAQHLVVFGKQHNKRDYQYTHIGHQSCLAQICTPEQVRKSIGKSWRTDPVDGDLGAAVIGTYQPDTESSEPIFHHLCASVQPREEPRQWLRIERGLFPFQLPEGAQVVVSVCAGRRAVDIPFCP